MNKFFFCFCYNLEISIPIRKDAKIDTRYQFERVGYFVLSEASDIKKGKYVYNRIVELKASKDKGANTAVAKK